MGYPSFIDKYDIDKVTKFIKRKVSNLEETYTIQIMT